MNKKLIAMAVGIVVVLGAIGVYVLSMKNDTQSSTRPATDATKVTNTTDQAASGNIFSLVEGGRAQKCTFSYSSTNGSGDGTMYSDGKGRGLMMIDLRTEKGNTGKSNTLVLADKVYGWTETNGKTIGFSYDKATFTNKTASTTNPGSGSSSVDPNQKFDLRCEKWSVDEAMLTVPSTVNFVTLPVRN